MHAIKCHEEKNNGRYAILMIRRNPIKKIKFLVN